MLLFDTAWSDDQMIEVIWMRHLCSSAHYIVVHQVTYSWVSSTKKTGTGRPPTSFFTNIPRWVGFVNHVNIRINRNFTQKLRSLFFREYGPWWQYTCRTQTTRTVLARPLRLKRHRLARCQHLYVTRGHRHKTRWARCIVCGPSLCTLTLWWHLSPFSNAWYIWTNSLNTK